MIRTIEWTDDGVVMIDQRLLPNEEVYNTYTTVGEVAEAIESMVIRGAPAIGVAAAMGIALGIKNLSTKDHLEEDFAKISARIERTRPTARNLFWAIERMTRLFEKNKKKPLEKIQSVLTTEAIALHREDIEINQQIGKHGQQLLSKNMKTKWSKRLSFPE